MRKVENNEDLSEELAAFGMIVIKDIKTFKIIWPEQRLFVVPCGSNEEKGIRFGVELQVETCAPLRTIWSDIVLSHPEYFEDVAECFMKTLSLFNSASKI